jgi:hypothetical protein
MNVLTQDQWVQMAVAIHHNKYDYSNVDLKDSRLKIICKTHGKFEMSSKRHIINMEGCPICNVCPNCKNEETGGVVCITCSQYYKTKEWTVVKYLRERLPTHTLIHNKSVGRLYTNTHLYPDIRFNEGNYNVIVEVDEYEHRGMAYLCDKQRMYNIIAKLNTPCIFIRYNPDSKSSNMGVLFNKVKKYLNMENVNEICGIGGLKCDYMYYKER